MMRGTTAVALNHNHTTLILAGRLIAGINRSGGIGFIKSAVGIVRQHGVAVLGTDAVSFRNEKRLVIIAGQRC